MAFDLYHTQTVAIIQCHNRTIPLKLILMYVPWLYQFGTLLQDKFTLHFFGLSALNQQKNCFRDLSAYITKISRIGGNKKNVGRRQLVTGRNWPKLVTASEVGECSTESVYFEMFNFFFIFLPVAPPDTLTVTENKEKDGNTGAVTFTVL